MPLLPWTEKAGAAAVPQSKEVQQYLTYSPSQPLLIRDTQSPPGSTKTSAQQLRSLLHAKGRGWTHRVSVVNLLHFPLAFPCIGQQGDGPIGAPTGQNQAIVVRGPAYRVHCGKEA